MQAGERASQGHSVMHAFRHPVAGLRDGCLHVVHEITRFRGRLTITAAATGDGPNIALCLTGPNRLCRRVRGVALRQPDSARRTRVPGLVRPGTKVVGLSVDLPPDSFLRPERRVLEVVGWRGTIPVELAYPDVLTRRATIAPALAARWDITLSSDGRGRLVVEGSQSDQIVTAHELVLTREHLVVGWESAAMTRELRLRHTGTGTALTVPGTPCGLRSVATIGTAELCLPGPGRWTVAIGEPDGPSSPLIQDRALQVTATRTRPVFAAATTDRDASWRVWVSHDAAGALFVRVEAVTPEPLEAVSTRVVSAV